MLFSVILASLLTDFGMTYGAPLFAAQAPALGISVQKSSTTASGGMFLQGPAGLLAVPLVQRYGRLPVLFWSQFATAFVVLGAALSPNYACFTAMRALQGWFNTAPQVVGLSVVHDMFFFHERTRRVNIWVYALLGGPFLGPFLSSWFILGVSWRADFGILAAFHGFTTVLIVLFGEETLYQRNSDMPAVVKEKGILGRIKLLTGITGAQNTAGRPEILVILKDIITIQIKPQIFFLSKSIGSGIHIPVANLCNSCHLYHGSGCMDYWHQPDSTSIRRSSAVLIQRSRFSRFVDCTHDRSLHRWSMGSLVQRLDSQSQYPHSRRKIHARDTALGHLCSYSDRLCWSGIVR